MKIPIVDKDDNIIGEEERSVIHKNGLRHREIHVWLVTSAKEFIFQKRGLHQETWPGYLDVTVGGHVDLATETYQSCAERELLEETGANVPLHLIMKRYSESYDPNTDTHNNAFRTTFAGIHKGTVSDLKIEKDAGEGFVAYSIDQLHSLSEEEKAKFIPRFFDEDYFKTYQQILDTLFI